MVRSSQSTKWQKRNIFTFVIRDFMLSMWWQPDAPMRFTNFVAKWHGSVHDSAIFNRGALQIHMQTKQQEGWLLGDRGYALQCYLMTHLNPDKVSSPAKENYHRIHTRRRNLVKRSFGLLKQRFQCLDFSGGTMQSSPSRCCNIIVPTVVLHNVYSWKCPASRSIWCYTAKWQWWPACVFCTTLWWVRCFHKTKTNPSVFSNVSTILNTQL